MGLIISKDRLTIPNKIVILITHLVTIVLNLDINPFAERSEFFFYVIKNRTRLEN